MASVDCAPFPPLPEFSMRFSALPSQWDQLSASLSGLSHDKGSFINALPRPFRESLSAAYDGTFQSIVVDINRALDQRGADAASAVFGVVAAAAARRRGVCWFPISLNAIFEFPSSLDWLLSVFLDKAAYARNEWRPVLDLAGARPVKASRACAEFGSVVYHDARGKLRRLDADERFTGAASTLAQFRQWAMASSNPLLYAIGRAARDNYTCQHGDECVTQLRQGRHFLPSSFARFLNATKILFLDYQPFFITFGAALGAPGHFWIAAEE